MNKAWEIENYLSIDNGRLTIDGHDAVALAREYATPLFVYSEPRIRHNIARLRRVGDQIGCPLKLCYAAKAMSTMGLLRAVRDAGCDLEVNSGGELWKALKAGFSGDQINFNGSSKEPWELEMAIEHSIYAIQVDSIYELGLIEEIARRIGKRANVSLRLVPEIESATHSGLQTALLTSKFGMMPAEAFEAFGKYKDAEYLKLAGIHLHIGSQNPSADVYVQALKEMFAAMLLIFRDTGVRLEHINLGGGFPVNYLRDNAQADDLPIEQQELFAADLEPSDAVASAWRSVRETAEKVNAVELLKGITLLLEPGRSIVGDAAICLTTVRNVKQRPLSNVEIADRRSQIENWVLTDAGFNILLSMETYKWYYHLISAERAGEPHDTPYKAAGPLCDGGDVYFDIEGRGRLPDHRMLPADVKPGEVLAFLNCGAYSLAQGMQYNGRFLPAVLMTKADGSVELIRRRDSFEDLVANDV